MGRAVDALDVRLAAAQRAVLAVVVVLAAVAVWRPLIDPFMLPKLTAIVLGAIALLTLAGVRGVRAARVAVPTGKPVWLAAAFAVTLVLATLTADNVMLALVGQHARYAGLLSYLAYLAVFVVAVRLYATGAVRGLTRGVLVALGVVTAYGLLQVAGGDPYIWNDAFNNPIFSTLGNTNFAAGYVAMTCPVAAAVALQPDWSRGMRIAAGVLLVLSLTYAVATTASQGVVGAAAGLAVVAIAWWSLQRRGAGRRAGRRPDARGRWQPVGLAALAVIAIGLMGARVVPDIARSLIERTQFWQASLGILLDHPVLGTGLDSFRDYFTRYRPAEHAVANGFAASDSTHNLPLGMLTSGGIPLGLTYLAFVGYTGWALVRGLRRVAAERLMPLAAFGGMWAAYQVQSLVSVDVPGVTFLHFLSAGVVIALAAPPGMTGVALPCAPARRGRLLPGSRVAGRAPAVAALAGVLVVCLFAVWTGTRPLRADLAASDARGTTEGAGLPALDRAVALAPWEAEYVLLQAQARLAAGQRDGAYEAAVAAAELRRGSSKLALGAADLSVRRADRQTASAWLREGLRRDPNNPLALEQAAALARQHGLDQDPAALEQRAERIRRDHQS